MHKGAYGRLHSHDETTLMNGLSLMTPDGRAKFIHDFGSALKQLHSLTAPDDRVSAFGGGPFRDWRIDHNERLGSIDSEKEFYEKRYSYVLLRTDRIYATSHTMFTTLLIDSA